MKRKRPLGGWAKSLCCLKLGPRWSTEAWVMHPADSAAMQDSDFEHMLGMKAEWA